MQMKTIGLIGGMSWESTVPYYQLINQTVKEALGGFHSAKCLLYSVDFHEIEACQASGEWEKSGGILTDAALRLQKAGADFLVICTNTMHKVVPQMEKQLSIPILHIADATAKTLAEKGIRKAALLGTRYTMEQDFYKDRIAQNGIEVVVPDVGDREFVNHVIYHELCLGVLNPDSRKRFLRIMEELGGTGAEGIILGCTEIGLLVKQEDSSVPLLDTTAIHARSAAQLALVD
jgi:aspartate racemase